MSRFKFENPFVIHEFSFDIASLNSMFGLVLGIIAKIKLESGLHPTHSMDGMG